MIATASVDDVRCPRCGYDQRGVMTGWVEACPLEGTCSECGLRYRWSEVLRPELFEPLWCVEFVERTRKVPRACLVTYLRSFWPWKFWSRLGMSHQIHPWRLLVYVCSLIFALLLCFVPLQGGVAVFVRYQVQNALDVQQQQYSGMAFSVQAALNAGGRAGPDGTPDPATMLQLRSQLVQLQQLQANPPQITMSYVGAVMEAILNPLAAGSSGSITYPGAAAAYIPPSMLWTVALYSGMGGWTSTGPIWTAATQAWTRWVLVMLALLLLMPASLALLPVSRRRAKVRWAHIGRVTVYSAFIPITMFFGCVALFGLGMAYGRQAPTYVEWMMWMLQVVPPMLVFAWWGAAIGRYLRIPHGHFTAFMLLVVCGLIIVTAFWFFDRRILIHAIL
jgi:hypothetical protein